MVGEKEERKRRGLKENAKGKTGNGYLAPPPSLSYACHTKNCSCMKLYFNEWGEEDSQHRIYLLSMSFFAVLVSNRWTVTS